MTPGQALAWRRSWLGRDLCRTPGRCTACGGHVATQGHAGHCPLGPRAIFTTDSTGRVSSRPTPPPAAEDARYGPPGTTEPRGHLPTTCGACGGYPGSRGAGHGSRCPQQGVTDAL